MEQKEFYTVQETATILSVRPYTVFRLIKSKRLIAANIGTGSGRNIYRISHANLNNFINQNSNDASKREANAPEGQDAV